MIVILIFLGTTFLVSLVHLTSVFNSKKVHSRKIFSLLIWVMLISVAVFIFVPSASVEVFSIFLVPASYIFSNYYTSRHQKQIVPELMFSGTVVVIITLQMFRLFNLSF